MVNLTYWLNPLPVLGKTLSSAPKVCINLGVGIVCGAVQALGLEVFTGNSVNEALDLKTAADLCQDELPVQLTSEYDQVASIMSEGGKGAVAKAKAVLKSSGVDDKCIAIFGLVCSKAQEVGALEIIKEACANLWV